MTLHPALLDTTPPPSRPDLARGTWDGVSRRHAMQNLLARHERDERREARRRGFGKAIVALRATWAVWWGQR